MKSEEYPKVYLYARIANAKLFIDRNYADKIDLDNISDEAFFSKFHFIRLFKSAYGKTPHQYVTAVRIEKSQQLFREGKNVKEVCLLVGFSSVTAFAGLFRKMTGKSPSQYLTHYQQLKTQIQKKPFAFIPQCYAYMHGWEENSNFEESDL